MPPGAERCWQQIAVIRHGDTPRPAMLRNALTADGAGAPPCVSMARPRRFASGQFGGAVQRRRARPLLRLGSHAASVPRGYRV